MPELDESKERSADDLFQKGDVIQINSNKVSRSTIDLQQFMQIYNSISRYTEFENSLLNQRLTWALNITSAFTVAQAFLGASVIQSSSQMDMEQKSLICFFMSGLSLCAATICFTSYSAIEAASRQLQYLRKFYYGCRINNVQLFEEKLYLPRPFGLQKQHLMGARQAKAIPPILIFMWLLSAAFELRAGLYFIQKANWELLWPSSMIVNWNVTQTLMVAIALCVMAIVLVHVELPAAKLEKESIVVPERN